MNHVGLIITNNQGRLFISNTTRLVPKCRKLSRKAFESVRNAGLSNEANNGNVNVIGKKNMVATKTRPTNTSTSPLAIISLKRKT
jgi:hypothetical protein